MSLAIISGGITVITILFAIAVLGHWGKPTLRAIKSSGKPSAQEWLIIGVSVSFVGQLSDGFYWLLAWSFHYLDPNSAQTMWLFDHGMAFNLPFRQGAGIIAAYCHMMAAVGASKAKRIKSRSFIITASCLGVFFSIWMIFAKNHYYMDL